MVCVGLSCTLLLLQKACCELLEAKDWLKLFISAYHSNCAYRWTMHGLLNSVTVTVPFMLHPWIDTLPASLCLKMLQLLCPSMTIHEWALFPFVIVNGFQSYYTYPWTIYGPSVEVHIGCSCPSIWVPGASKDRQWRAGVYPCSCCLEWWSMNTGWRIVCTLKREIGCTQIEYGSLK